MRRDAGLARREVVVLVVVVLAVAGAAAVMLRAIVRAREEARRVHCRSNFNQLARGMAAYLNRHGSNRCYPCPLGRGTRPDDYNGAEWLAALYWTDVLLDPGVYLCPSTDDTNHAGYDLGTHKAIAGRFDWDTVSYAGLGYRSLTGALATLTPAGDDFPPNLPIAAHDTEGPRPYNPHGGGTPILFFDSHVEIRTRAELEVLGWSADRPPTPLRN